MEKYIPYLIPALIFAFFIYLRIKRTIGFQKFKKRPLIVRITLFTILSVWLFEKAVGNNTALLADGGGIMLGLALAYLAVNHIKFEKRTDGLYYRTHLWVEITVLAVFFARLLYRFYTMYATFGQGQSPEEIRSQLQNMKDPFTGAVFFILCAYFIGYCSYVLRNSNQKMMELGEVQNF